VHLYTDTTGTAPQIWIQQYSGPGRANPRTTGSMFYFMLPYLEQKAIFDYGSSLTNPAVPPSLKYSGQAANDKLIKIYLCPSDPPNPSNRDDGGAGYAPNYFPGASQFTNAIDPTIIGATGFCYAGNVLVFDPNPLESFGESTSAETGRAKATLAHAMPDGTST